jgi:Protein of unknown function (DUF3224)
MTARATFEVKSWDEQPFDEGVGVAKLTRAVVTKEYSGEVTGSSTTETLMAYESDGTASFIGLERIRGTVDGKRGSIVIQHVGAFDGKAATATLTVVSGTDELRGATGTGRFLADPAGSVELDVEVTE